jgi:phosphatidate cytidylyltransferase
MNKTIIGIILSLITQILIKRDMKTLIFLMYSFSIIEILDIYFNNITQIKKKRHHFSFILGIIIILLVNNYSYHNYISTIDFSNIIKLCSIGDSMQQIVGKLFGKHKIGWISPNKTFEGYFGGYFLLLIINKILLKKYFMSNKYITGIYAFSIIGDLFFSYLKRIINIKDWSTMLQSHGGFLDRLNSIYMAIFSKIIAKLFISK